jgi:multimeric flavodoxin WrbA
VLHGNRTYLLQDDDGQILEGHSISAGLDYPGIGPEHSWLKDIGRVEYVRSRTRRRWRHSSCCTQGRGHHPGAGAEPRARPCVKLAPTMARTRSSIMNMCGRGDKDVMAIMEKAGVGVSMIRAADHAIAFGIYPDMREHGADHDDWPDHIWPKVSEANILVIGTPLWLGEESSICRVIIERLYAHSGQQNDKGQGIFYGKTGGCIITGNEDGVKHAAMTLLYAMQHVGYTIPPQADCGWIGEVGPGASYGDDGAGYDNDFTQKNTTFMTWNLIHIGIACSKMPAASRRTAIRFPNGSDGERFGHPDLSESSA